MIDVGAALTRKIGPLPAVAWGGIIGVGVLVARTLRGGGTGGSGGSPTIVGADLGDLSGGGGGSSNPGPPTVDNGEHPAAPPPLRVVITTKTSLYDAAHKLVGHVTKATYTVVKGPSHGGGYYWYRIVAPNSSNNNRWVLAKPDSSGKLIVKA